MQFAIQEIQHLGPALRLGVGVRLGTATVLNRIGVVSCRRAANQYRRDRRGLAIMRE